MSSCTLLSKPISGTIKLSRFLSRRILPSLSVSPRYESNGVVPAKLRPADSFISWDTGTPVKLRMTETGPGKLPPILIQTMMRNTVNKYGDVKALFIKREGEWISWSYRDYLRDIKIAALGFHKLGLERRAAIGIMSANCPEWFITSLGSIYAGGLICGIYTTNSPESVAYIANHAPLNILVLEDADMLRRILTGKNNIREAWPSVKKVVLVEGVNVDGLEDVITWAELMEIGSKENENILLELEKDQAANDAAMFIYTSGTTGPPKGAMLSHDNVTWTCRYAHEQYWWEAGNSVALSFLPLSHVAAHLAECYMTLYMGGTTYFADKFALKGTLVENLKVARPTQILGVPRVYEKIMEKMQEAAAQRGPIMKAIGTWAKSQATNYHRGVREGRIKLGDEPLGYKIARKVVFKKIHEALGLERLTSNKVGFAYSSAAPLADATFDYFESIDIQITELLGSTETSGPQTTNMPGTGTKKGSVGRHYKATMGEILDPHPITGVGEYAPYSRNVFMGYHKSEDQTKNSFTADFKYKSGDLGRIDDDGFLFLHGRLKELIITAGGENIAPIPIENNIKDELPDVLSYVVVVGDKRKYLTCLLTLRVVVDPETLLPTDKLDPLVVTWAKEKLGITGLETVEDFRSGKDSDRLRDAIHGAIKTVNEEKAVANPHKVQKFLILPHELSLTGGELGPTLKLKRYAIYEKYHNEINSMYD